MNISKPFIQRPVMTTFVMLAIVLAGWIAFQKLPVSDLPTIEHPKITITAGYTGANPEVVLNQLTIPLEKELAHVKGIEEMVSKSSPGQSTVSLTFNLNKSMFEATQEVQTALNRADALLPRDVDPRPAYKRQEGGQDPIMYMLLTSDSSSPGDLREYAESYILPRLNRIEGVAQVYVFGVTKSIWVRLNPEVMASRGVGFNQVIDTIRQHTKQLPVGSIQTGSKTLAIELPASVQDIKELENLKIGATTIRIKDIGEVSDKSTDDPEFHFVAADKTSQAVILGLQKVSEANTVSLSEKVHKTIAEIKKELPPSIQLEIWFDKAVWIHESILDVEWSLLFAFLLVVVVIYLSLGKISDAFIPSLALPLSLVGTLVVMYLLNYSLDLLSLLALTLSVGFVVDDAIVVLENIVRHQEKGESPLPASLKGSKEICFTIVSMTLSLVAVFIPLLFMEGMDGRLFREFSITLAAAILVSGFISLTLTPMLCSKLLRKREKHTKVESAITAINGKMSELYGCTLRICFRYSKTVLLIAFLCMAACVPLFSKLSVNLVPPEDRGLIIAPIGLPAGISSKETLVYQKRLEDLVRQNAHVENFLSIGWEGNIILVIRLHPLGQRPSQNAVIAELQKGMNEIPGIQAFLQGYQLINLDLEFGQGGKFKYIVKGSDFAGVDSAAAKLVENLQKKSEFPFVQSTQKNDTPKLVVHVNEEQANKFGLTNQQIQMLLQNAHGQGLIGTIQKGPNEEKIFMELLSDYRNKPSALAKLYLTSPQGDLVPLKALAKWEEKLGSPKLIRRDQLPAATIQFSLADKVSPEMGLKMVEEIAKKELPAGISGSLDGSAKAISGALNSTMLLLLAAAVIMYMVLGILYESFKHPLTILSSLPFAGLGGILTLFLFNEPLSIFSAVGFLLLLGIVKKNGIMMVDFAIEAQKQGMTAQEAIYQGCIVRFRPIMMTTAAAIMGAIPIAIGFGSGADMHRGLGLVIAGGLLFSQLLTLYVTPILFLTIEKISFSRVRVINEI